MRIQSSTTKNHQKRLQGAQHLTRLSDFMLDVNSSKLVKGYGCMRSARILYRFFAITVINKFYQDSWQYVTIRLCTLMLILFIQIKVINVRIATFWKC